ncbi:3-isopropylmalate dehydratase small subunit [Paracoccus beibuensis]|uniref:3-isopropylmalate dehydratase small subunit n=1 Tax=Paracoccus beibuensis TaxID=547602 RepID=UPI002AD26649|nr:3-isopropylmalate dehydratase small subunit [Paracoccus beibuensis]
MKPFVTETGPGVALPMDNIDTDQLIPARFMKRSRTEGYGQQLLFDLRHDADGSKRPDMALNYLSARPVLLIAGANFGCGSSREAAVYALVDHGIRCVVAKSFADIFRNNALRNGLLTVTCGDADHQALTAFLSENPGGTVAADLRAQTISWGQEQGFPFDIDDNIRRRLLLGMDELSETLEYNSEIEEFEQRYRHAYPWMAPHSSGSIGPSR